MNGFNIKLARTRYIIEHENQQLLFKDLQQFLTTAFIMQNNKQNIQCYKQETSSSAKILITNIKKFAEGFNYEKPRVKFC